MSDRDTLALLQEALEFFNDHPNFGLRRDRSRTSYKLAARIDDHLRKLDGPAHPAIAEARERWAATSFVRIDAEESRIELTSAGAYWVRAWILVERPDLGGPESSLRRRYEAAVAALPARTRQVFLAHRVEDLAYAAIAKRLAISVREVEQHIAQALVSISAALDD
jgi:DNA-directed RNA polymerase specialized sigma24 family protein